MFDMNISERFPDERAVSPVIGVILMVAVVVVLAAVVTGFVFGLGDELSDSQPTVDIAFDYDANNGQLEILHDGGDQLDESNVGSFTVTSSNSSHTVDSAFERFGVDSSSSPAAGAVAVDGPVYTSGDTIALIDDDGGGGDLGGTAPAERFTAGDEITLEWSGPNGDQTGDLGSFVIPVDSSS